MEVEAAVRSEGRESQVSDCLALHQDQPTHQEPQWPLISRVCAVSQWT